MGMKFAGELKSGMNINGNGMLGTVVDTVSNDDDTVTISWRVTNLSGTCYGAATRTVNADTRFQTF